MPDPRRLLGRKWSPALLFGKVDAQDVVGSLDVEVDDGSITPTKLDRSYVEATFGAEAEGQPTSILRKLIRLWVQDDKIYGESSDEF